MISDLDTFPDAGIFGASRNVEKSGFLPMQAKNYPYPEEKIIIPFVSKIPFTTNNIITINLDKKRFESEMETDKQGIVLIDKDKNTLYYNNDYLYSAYVNAKDKLLNKYLNHTDIQVFNSFFENQKYYYFISGNDDFSVVSVVPHSQIANGMNRSITFIYVIILLCLINALVFFAALKKVYTKPVDLYNIFIKDNIDVLRSNLVSDIITGKIKYKEAVKRLDKLNIDLVMDRIRDVVAKQFPDFTMLDRKRIYAYTMQVANKPKLPTPPAEDVPTEG
jgi:hypothetical protein